jgi:iron complex transport system permease protein
VKKRAWSVVIGLGLLLVLAAWWRVVGFGGAGGAGPGGGGGLDGWGGAVLELRLLRVGVAATVGAALGVAGVMLQSLLRNPLASPDLLGLASGASLAVMVAALASARGGLGGAGSAGGFAVLAWQGGPALVGALGVLALVYGLAQRRGLVDPVALVLVGVVVSVMCGAGVMFVQQLMPDRGFEHARLLMGAISDETSWGLLGAVAVVTLLGVAAGAWSGPALDAASLGDDEAVSVGVGLGRLRLGLFLLAGVLTAGAVVLAGPIGFVGLVGPHAVRLLAGPSHRGLVVGSAVAGALVVVLAEAVVKAVDVGSGRMPIGIVMALVGGPVLVVLLRRVPRA